MSNLTYRHEIKKFKLVRVEDTSPVDESTEFCFKGHFVVF